MNPYEPPNERISNKAASTGWLRRFLILNGVLLAVPVSITLLIYATLRVDLAMKPDNINGDPVTYQQEFIGVSGPIWPVISFFVIPNLILIAVFGWSVLVQRTDANE